MPRIIAVCPSCNKDDNFDKTLSPDYYYCNNCKVAFHYTEMNLKMEGENDITTKGVTIEFGSVTRNGKAIGFPFV